MTYPVVGIGASAGGLEAVSGLLSGLSSNTGMALVLIQHLHPDHPSLLAEILAKRVSLPVEQVQDGMAVEPDHLYVIPPNTSMSLGDGHLRLAVREADRTAHKPIDVFFKSLAEECGRNAIGVVLSGTGSDGTRGLQDIREAGGVTFAEEPVEAAYADMPRNAIEAGGVDFILSPPAIGRALIRLGQRSDLKADMAELIDDPSQPEEAQLRRIYRLMHAARGIDFRHYKRSTFRRRLARRMAVHSMTELDAYADFLDDNQAELQALCQDVLIRFTGFFRDPKAFKCLSKTVFPALLEKRALKDPLRIWVPGCASGEEAYSIAICLVEFLGTRAPEVPIQIFGTDANEEIIATARAGRYPGTIADDISEARLKRFFVRIDDGYQVTKSIRDLCLFARQNVARDPPFSKLDVVSCRNLLIYFDRELQKQVMSQFHYALKRGGFLVLGLAESIGACADLFELVDNKHKIYQRLTVSNRASRAEAQPAARPASPRQAQGAAPTPIDANWGQWEAERLLLSRYAPACVLVDEGMHVVYFQGDTSRYLEHAPGPASLNLRKLAPAVLLVELAQAMQAVRQDGEPVRREGIRLSGGAREVAVEVIPRQLPESNAYGYLIVFEDAPADPEPGTARARRPRWRSRGSLWGSMLEWKRGGKPAPGRDAATPVTSLDPHAGHLQRKLESTQDYLHAIIEQHESTVEELKSSHEEVLSTNEEYQSVNEELETAKEELQSGNEELITTNEELRLRNADLQELTSALKASRDYAQAIVETIGESLLVLDARLKVVQANRAFYECFETKPEATEQRFIYDLGEGEWNIPGLRALFEEILPRDAHFRDYEMTHEFPTIGHKTLRLNARRLAGDALRPELILLAIDDISARAEREQFALYAEKERYRTTLASISEAVIATNAAGHVEYLNGVAEQYTGWSNEEAQGQPLARVFNVLDASTRKPLGNVAKIAMVDGRVAGVGTHLQLLRRGGEEFPVDAVAAPLHGPDGNAIVGVVVSFRDVSSQRRLSEKLSYQANHDALTGLVNRREFERRLQRLIETSDANQSHALLYLDLDQFKLINDTCGHSAGDEMLRQVTAILHTQLRARDTLARLGGDEFGVLLEHCPLEEALRVANDLRRAVHDFRFVRQGKYFTLGLSVGLVSVTESDGSLEAVLGAADRACYAAKDGGRNRVHVFQLDDPAMAQRHGDMQWVPRIQSALAEGRFRLYSQPIVALASDLPCGEWGEILLRLIDEQGKIILPEAFMPAAERYDQMYAIDRWVIGETIKVLRAQPPEAPPTRYAINVSGQSVGNEDLLEFVTEQLDGIAPGRLCFEITESAAIGNLRVAGKLISTLKEKGCCFALDDFGCGLSSFAYLKTLDVDYLKLDGGFVRNMTDSPVDRAIVEAAHQVSQALDLKTIAESVENDATLEALKAMGIDYAQGLGIAPPRALELG